MYLKARERDFPDSARGYVDNPPERRLVLGFVFKAHRREYQLTLGLRVMKNKQKFGEGGAHRIVRVREQAEVRHCVLHLQGYFDRKKQPPPRTLR